MAVELREAAEVIEKEQARSGDKDGEETEARLQTALQALLLHQVIYSDSHGVGGSYELILRNQAFFRRYFATMGFELFIDPAAQCLGLSVGETSFGWKQNRLRKDETLVALVLRLMLEEGTRASEIDEVGRVDTDTDALFDRYRTLAGEDPPTESRLIEILRAFQRRGMVRIGERDRDEQVTPVLLMPGIRRIVTDRHVEAVSDWCARRTQGEEAEGDVFHHIQTFDAEPAETEG